MKRIGNLNYALTRRPYIYRIELLDRFYNILRDKELVFVHPAKWEDPLENLIFNARIIKNGKDYEHPVRKKAYAQCWSYEGDSYGIWKIYTTKADDAGKYGRHLGVRITTHLRYLNQLTQLNSGKFFYGVVNYLPKNALEKLPSDPQIIAALQKEKISEEHLRTLLVKRRSYSYEKEVRLFTLPGKELIDTKRDFLCRVKIDPLKFISSLRFDPGMDYNEFKERREELVRKYGFRSTQITQSSYFRKNKFVIRIS